MTNTSKKTDISTQRVILVDQCLPPHQRHESDVRDFNYRTPARPILRLSPRERGITKVAVKGPRTLPELILVRGLPGSGKGMVAKAVTMVGYVAFEANMYFRVNGRHEYDRKRIQDAHAWCESATREALRRGENVVVCNTFVSLSEMTPYFEMGAGVVKVFEAGTTAESALPLSPEVRSGMAARWEQIPARLHSKSLQVFTG